MQVTPPNGAPRSEPPKKDVAVYIDYENLYISLRSTVGKNPQFDVILEKCREFGRVTVARAYADWSEFARVVTSQLFASGVEPIYVPTRKFYDARTRAQATKNSVDIHITIDIMKDVLLQRNIDIFVLVSGDRDFVPLMNQIRATGKEVYAIGVAGCTSSELAVAVDEMFYYHQLLETDEEVAAEQHDIYAKLTRAVEVARARGYRATLGVVKPIMREIVVGFDERKARNSKGQPFGKFKNFCQEAERLGFIKIANTGDAVELFLAKETPGEVARPPRERPGRPERAERPERPERAERAERPERAERVARREETAPSAEALVEGAPGPEAAAEGEEKASGGGRRRGRRGGRRRRRGGAGVEAAGGEGAQALEGSAEHEGDEESDAALLAPPDDETAEAPREEDERPAAPARRAVSGVRRSLTRLLGAAEPDEEVAERPAARPRRDEDEADDEDESAAADASGISLPDQAFDDLRVMMDTFKGRAPSQRLLIARLKRGAANGELRGEYQEGQFLLLVRKALEEGKLVKVSKRFSSGLQWSEGSPS